jgi:hypothetical protein
MSYTAIIVEPRKHKALEYVLNNFLTNLSSEWDIIVFHGSQNIEFVEHIIARLNTTRISLINLGVRNLTPASYSKLLVSADFYKYIPTETFLIFQTDTLIFKQNKHKINDFLHYDYVGAPWTDPILKMWRVSHGGNGGLSLRKKSKMLEIIETKPYRGQPEDVYFCTSTIPLKIPTINDAKNFSVELLMHATSFGCHKPWRGRNYTQLLNLYPEVKTLYDLNQSSTAKITLPKEFDWKLYTMLYPDLQRAGINTEAKAKQHWLNYGHKEKRIYAVGSN